MSEKQIIEDVLDEDGNPLVVGEWYAAKGASDITVGAARFHSDHSVGIGGYGVNKHYRIFKRIPPIEFRADREAREAAERKAKEEKERREAEIEVAWRAYLRCPPTEDIKACLPTMIDALDAHRKAVAK